MVDPTNGGATTPAVNVCGNCGGDDHKILHNVRHRGIFRRLCTSCVLRVYPQSFCPTCFVVYKTPVVPNSVVTCVKCYSSSHSGCVGPTSQPCYYCPMCVSPGEPVFVFREAGEGGAVIDQRGARVLVAAAMISSLSMKEAEVAARAVAERRAKEAAITRKRAMQALDNVAAIASREKMKKAESVPGPRVGVGGISRFRGNVGSGVTERGDGYGYGYGRGGNGRSDVVAGVRFEEKKQFVGGVVDRCSSEVLTSALNAGSVVDRRSNEVLTSGFNGGNVLDRGSNEVLTSASNDASVVDRSSNGVLTSALNDGSVVDRRPNEVLTSALDAVELRENGRLGGVGQQSSGVSELSTSDGVPMDVDERRGISSGSGVEVGDSAVLDSDGRVLNERSGDPDKLHNKDPPNDSVNDGVVLHPPKEDLMEEVVSGNPMKQRVESTDPGQNKSGMQH